MNAQNTEDTSDENDNVGLSKTDKEKTNEYDIDC